MEWAKVRPSRYREGLGGGCLDQILTRMKCNVYMYVCGLDRLIVLKFFWNGLRVQPSRNREGLGGRCLDQILTRMKCLVYMYVWGLE